MKLIDAVALRKAMYHEAFETDSDMQKWDSGCWIRYKMFEEQIEKQPTIDAMPVWIPCSERLPEEDGQYLITVKYKHVNESYEDVYAEHGEWFDGKWDMFSFGHCGEVEDIIAWMPLPEPYKMDEVTG